MVSKSSVDHKMYTLNISALIKYCICVCSMNICPLKTHILSKTDWNNENLTPELCIFQEMKHSLTALHARVGQNLIAKVHPVT